MKNEAFVGDVFAAVCGVTGVSLATIKGPMRNANAFRARSIASYLLRRNAKMPYEAIGRLLNRHHSSIIYECRELQGKLGDTRFRREQDAVRRATEALAACGWNMNLMFCGGLTPAGRRVEIGDPSKGNACSAN